MNIRKIVVAMDQDPVSLQALEEVMPLARRIGAEIVLVHVGPLYESYPQIEMFAPATVELYDEVMVSRQSEMRAQLAEVRERHSGQGVDISVSLVPGLPESAIPDAEADLGADMIVVGSHGRKGFQRLLAGSVAERIVRRSKKMVLVARNPTSNLPYQRILVATDFSPASESALEAALQFAAPTAEVTLLHCWQLPSSGVGTNPLMGKIAQGIEERANAEMDTLVRKFEGDFVLRKEIAFGYPAAVIRDQAAECDLIALGSNGRKGLARYLLGSVAELTVRHAPCSVLVAHGGEDD